MTLQSIQSPQPASRDGHPISAEVLMPKVYGARNDGHRDFMFTFDDGPHPTLTNRLLDILKKHSVPAMFFALGERLATADGAAIAKRAQAEGHIVGNHTFSHPNLRNLEKDKVRDELRRTHDLICSCAGACTYFRPPYGSSSSVVAEVLTELGYTSVGWNVDTEDWKRKRDAAWVDHGMEQIKAREDSIVLMHDIHKTTVDSVETLITRIKKIPGYRFTTY